MNKELLLDLDGIVIRPRKKYFSETYSQDYDVPLEDIIPFFRDDYKRAAVGGIDIREVLPTFLAKGGWKGTGDGFLRYWFGNERDVDEKVLDIVRDLRQKGVKVHLASDNETHRAKYLMDEVGLRKQFDKVFFSCDLGCTKGEPQFFEKVINGLQVKPEEIEYWDDDRKNVEVAKSVGIKGKVYTTFEEFKT